MCADRSDGLPEGRVRELVTGVACPGCGEFNGVSPQDVVVRLDTHRLEDLRVLLRLGVDSIRCRFCDSALPVAREVSVEGDRWTEQATIGADGDAAGQLAGLRGRVTDRLNACLDGLVAEVERAGDDGWMDVVQRRWREFSFEVAAACWLAGEHAPGMHPSAAPAGRGQVSWPVRFSAQAFMLVMLTAFFDDEPDRAVEPFLGYYASPGLVAAPAVELLAAHVAELSWERLTLRSRWVASLTVAWAAVAANVPDPEPSRTAQSYFGYAWSLSARDEDLATDGALPASDLLRLVLSEDALASAALLVAEFNTERFEDVQRVLERAGHPELLRSVSGRLPAARSASLETMRGAVEEIWGTRQSVGVLAQVVQMMLRALVGTGREESTVELVDHAIHVAGDGPEVRAALLGQLGAALKDARRPRMFLDRVGREPASWEATLEDRWKMVLGVERSNALRLAGDPYGARAVLEQVAGFEMDVADQQTMRLNIAILKRETGSADGSLADLQALVAEPLADPLRFEVLQSLVTTASFVGDHELERVYLPEAIRLAVGQHADARWQLEASSAALDAAAGSPIEVPVDMDAIGRVDPRAVLAWGAAVAAALEHDIGGVPAAGADSVLAALRGVAEVGERDGDRMMLLTSLRVTAGVKEAAKHNDAFDAWATLVETRGQQDADPFELAMVALHLFRVGEPDTAGLLLSRVPQALSRELGDTRDLRAVIDATGRLRRTLAVMARELARRDFDAAGPPVRLNDLRLVGELQRDALGAVVEDRRRPADGASASAGMVTSPDGETPGTVFAGLCDPPGVVRVLDWVETPTNLIGTLTTIEADRLVSRLVEPLPTDVVDAARRVRSRLNGWRPGRSGDPLDFEPWTRIELWLRRQLFDAQPGDHLVVVEHQWLAGLPWHAIDAPWTTSYAPGWRALRRIAEARPKTIGRVGVVSVPALGDSDVVRSAFERSSTRTRRWAETTGRIAVAPDPVASDRRAVVELLSYVDLLKVQAHGLLVPDDHEVAVMVAANGRLPPQHLVAASTSTRHRLSWRDLQDVDVGPDVVVSAACSTGASVIGGLGERLGLYGILRHAGTRAVVAPAWDCVADDVLTMIDQVVADVADGRRIVDAVRGAADDAARTLPAWRARVLAIEGDWR